MYRTTSILVLAFLTLPAFGQEVEVGYASWYNRGFHGLSTSSGEAYDHEGLTAAHPSLPFGTMVQVTRTDDGRRITVRINDRMQSGPGHIIDLSGAAARELGLVDTGVARVRLVTTGYAPATANDEYQPAASTGAQPSGSYTLQIGVYSTRHAAEEAASERDGSWIRQVSGQNGPMYRVYFGSFDAESSARSAQDRLKRAGVDSFLRSVSQ